VGLRRLIHDTVLVGGTAFRGQNSVIEQLNTEAFHPER
jgi:hypothetical protein